MSGDHRGLLVPLRDGAELAADLYLPDGDGPHPVVASYYPYHKDDVIGAAYEYANRYLAAQGYAALVVDFRGLGGSGGVAAEAFHESEGDDLYDIVEWAASQDWSDGNVGMWGLSYGGITSLRAAAARPPSLRAIVPMMCTLDLYDHWFYPGGCRNMLGVYGVWGPMMLAMGMMPPMHHDDAGRWREVWHDRLERARPYLLDWPGDGHRDEGWAAKAIDGRSIEVPTFLVGGWRDIFPQGVIEAYEEIDAPKKLLMGPWLHTQPDASPFDAVEYLPMMAAWFDRWLRGGSAPGASADATVFVQGAGWRRDGQYPPEGADFMPLYLAADGLLASEEADGSGEVEHVTDPTAGTAAGLWDPLGLGIGLPLEQSADDARSLTFTSEPLTEPVDIVGTPEAVLAVSIRDADDAHLVVKLCDVAPDGRSSLITTGWLRALHREGHDRPAALPEAGSEEYTVRLWATGYRVPTGHRLRVGISGSDFPRIWPSATSPNLSVAFGGSAGSRIRIPTVASGSSTDLDPPAPGVDRAPLNLDADPRWQIRLDPAAGRIEIETGVRSTLNTPSGDGHVDLDHRCVARVSRDRPQDASVTAHTRVLLHPPDGSEVVVETSSRSTADTLSMSGSVTIDGVPFFRRDWSG